jgi:flagellar biosynthesis protein FlhB
LAQYFPFQSPMSLLPASFNDWFGPKFNIKLYTDVLVYYSFLLFIAMLAVASHYMPSLRRLLHTTVVRRSDSEGALRTIGEYLLWCSVIILFVFWTVYFATILPAREKDDVQVRLHPCVS